MSSDGTVIPGRPQGSNPFLLDSAFLDVMSRLGFFDLDELGELEAFWWFMGPEKVTPEDLASAVMKLLPPETDKEASIRRMGLSTYFTKEEVKEMSPRIKKKKFPDHRKS